MQIGEETPNIFKAAREGRFLQLMLARDAGQTLDDIDPETGRTPVHEACLHGHADLVGTFIGWEFDPWIADNEGKLATDHAQAHSDADMMTIHALLNMKMRLMDPYRYGRYIADAQATAEKPVLESI